MSKKFRRTVKNFIWFFKYCFEFFQSFFWIKNDVGSLIVTVDVETFKDFIGWQNKEAALSHALVSRKAILEMVKMTEKHKIPITWLCTGRAFLENNREPLSYFGDLVNCLLASEVKHEIGSHTFSHLHCRKITRQQFENDMQRLVGMFQKKKIKLQSHAYPWNEENYLSSLKKFGIKTVRLKQGMFPGKVLKPKTAGGLNFIFQSLEGTPPSSWIIKFGLNVAVRSGTLFVWLLHPEDFSSFEEKRIIEKIFKYADLRRAEGKLKIITMGEIL